MSELEQERYDFIVDYTTDNLYPPTLEEIGEAVGRSRWAVSSHLKRMDKLGVIEIPFHMASRSIRLVGYKLVKEHDYDKKVGSGKVRR